MIPAGFVSWLYVNGEEELTQSVRPGMFVSLVGLKEGIAGTYHPIP